MGTSMNKNEQDMFPPEPKAYKIKYRPSTTQNIDMYLYDFESPAEMSDFIDVINKADDDDKINIHIQSRGGDVSAGIQILNTIEQNIHKKLTLYVDGDQYSMGAIFVARWVGLHLPIIVSKDAMLMFHNYSSGHGGKGQELVTFITKTDKWLQKVFRENCVPFLTNAELDELIKDQDKYFYHKEIIKRVKRVYKEV